MEVITDRRQRDRLPGGGKSHGAEESGSQKRPGRESKVDLRNQEELRGGDAMRCWNL